MSVALASKWIEFASPPTDGNALNSGSRYQLDTCRPFLKIAGNVATAQIRSSFIITA